MTTGNPGAAILSPDQEKSSANPPPPRDAHPGAQFEPQDNLPFGRTPKHKPENGQPAPNK